MKSTKNNFSLERLDKTAAERFVSVRTGETKLGQRLASIEAATYVLIVIAESVGPRANHGKSGAENGGEAFLSKLLNMQSNEFLSGDSLCVWGTIQMEREEPHVALHDYVSELDDFIQDVLTDVVNAGQVPIVVGGGHNNAFPLIRFKSQQLGQRLTIVNLDAHADYRSLEGRHSGNSFSYAFNQGFIDKYHVFGLHPRYNSQKIIDDLRKDNHYFTFDTSYLDQGVNYLDDFVVLQERFQKNNAHVGLELDMDAIAYMPSSAMTPVGISLNVARQYIRTFGTLKNVDYLHLPEAAPKTDREAAWVGKALAYFVTDFIEMHGKSLKT